MPGKSIAHYKQSMEKKETLAMANIAKRYMDKGFYKEAKDVLMDAVIIKDHNRSVDYYLNELDLNVENEGKKEKELLGIAKEYRHFLLDYAVSIAIPFDPTDIKGLWRSDHPTIERLSINFVSPNSITGEHSWEDTQAINALSAIGSLVPPITKKKSVSLSGNFINAGFKFTIQLRIEPPPHKTLLGMSQQDEELSGIGIVSQDKQAIKFLIDMKNNFQTFTAYKLVS